MTDLEIAIANLGGHSICLCRNGDYFTEDGKGISPIMRLIDENRKLKGFSVADVIVGKAAAMLFVKEEIVSVYGKIMSYGAITFLEHHGIHFEYDELTKNIINHQGTDICPMEKTVDSLSDVNDAYKALLQKIK